MKVQALVSRVQTLDAQDQGKGKKYDTPLRSVSLEGLSCLVRDGNSVPEEGRAVSALVEVQWRKGARPLHWLRAWEYVPILQM